MKKPSKITSYNGIRGCDESEPEVVLAEYEEYFAECGFDDDNDDDKAEGEIFEEI